MSRPIHAIISIAMIFLAAGATMALAAQPPADLVIHNGPIHTMDAKQSLAGMVAVRGDRIAYVGNAAEVERWTGPATRIIDLQGRAMTPGFIESHGHLLYLGHSRMRLDLSGARNYDELVAMVAEAASGRPAGEWILGSGWHQSKWEPPAEPLVKGFQTHHALSRATPDHPVYLTHASGHAGMANARAMHTAGISARTEAAKGGEIIKDASGSPTGIFVETAQALVRRHIPSTTPAKQRRAMQLAMEQALANGITTFHDSSSDRAAIDLYREFLDQGKLGLRLWVMINGKDQDLLEEWYARGPQVGGGNHFLTIRAIKLFADGALGSRGAWLLEPYEDRPGHSGHATMDMEAVHRIALDALTHGFQLCVHAIGDRANREVLNQFERAFRRHPTAAADHRFRIEHAQHIHPQDIPRFAQWGVIASMQAIHHASDRPWAIHRLGAERISNGAYVWQKLIQSGARVINGTDTPVEPIDPMANFYAAITRKTLDGQPPGGYEPGQRMTRRQALATYTLGAAYAGFEEKLKGSIETGKLADLTIFSQDIMTIPEQRLLSTRVDVTIVGGRIAYTRTDPE